MKKEILTVEHLSVSFEQYGQGFSRRRIQGVHDLNLSIREGEIVAVAGSSGSGKSLLAHAIMGILPYNAHWKGQIRYEGELLTEDRIRALRGKEISLVPQNVSYLDPLMKVGKQIMQGKKDPERKEECRRLFEKYGLAPETEDLYPFQLSGGMARRIFIVMALLDHPKLVIADEPTPGLHREAVDAVMKEFRGIADTGAGVLLITHDLSAAIRTADRIVIFRDGETVEEVSSGAFDREELFQNDYTRELFRSLPENW